jgi:tetratricopeptide (TPR) repeat protein
MDLEEIARQLASPAEAGRLTAEHSLRELPPERRIEALNTAGQLAFSRNDYGLSRCLYEKSVTASREAGGPARLAFALHKLASRSCDTGDYEAAQAAFAESLTLYQELGDQPCIAMSLTNLGTLACYRREDAAARSLCEESLVMRRELGLEHCAGGTLHVLGLLAHRRGDAAVALSLLRQSLAIRWEWRDMRSLAESLLAFALVAAEQEQPYEAARLLGAVDALCRDNGLTLPFSQAADRDSIPATIRSRLGEDAFQAARTEGRVMPLEEVVRCLLDDPVR